MEIVFKTKNDKQIEAVEYWIDNETDEILYGGAKGGGKSYLGASLIFGDALIYPDTHYFIARKELNDLRKFTIPTIHEVFKNWGLKMDDVVTQGEYKGKPYATFNGQDNCFYLYNDSKVFLIACKDEPSDPLFERFGSMQMTRGWIEEGGEVPEDAKSNLALSIGRWKNDVYGLRGKLLVTANPKKGWMKRDFVDMAKKDILPRSRKYIQAFATDNKYLPAGYVEKLHAEKNNVRRQRLAEGNWEYDEDKDSLISFDALSDAFSNTIVKDNQKYMVVDVARLGKDSTVFSFWDGLELYKLAQFQKQDTEQTKQQAKDFAASEKIPYSHILIDEDGVGGGVVDGLLGVKGFMGNFSPMPTATETRTKQSKLTHEFVPKTNFKNIKAQCGWKLAELINEHKIAFKVPDHRDTIIEELTAMLRDKEVDSEGKKQLRTKDDVKKDLNNRSPDVGDTILMRAWFELKKDAVDEDPNRPNIVERQQDQFAMRKKNLTGSSTK